jgi:hypothetical protein
MPTLYDLEPAFQDRLRPMVGRMARKGVTPNQVTLAALALSLATGAAMTLWPFAVLWLVPLLLLAHMGLDAIDGMLAREHGMTSRTGAVPNEIGDMLADAALYLPLTRSPGRGPDRGEDPLVPLEAAHDRGGILILFPEGSRGEPERPTAFKTGIAHLVRRRPEVPVVPVCLHGLGKALPKGEALLVPVICDVLVGEPFVWTGERATFMAELEARMQALAAEGRFPVWD